MKLRIFIIFLSLLLIGSFVLLQTRFFWDALNPIFYRHLLNQNAGIYKIDPLLIAAIIQTESKFYAKAESEAGAIGLMQIMPATGREIAKKLNLTNFHENDLYVPEINIRIGCYYIYELRREFGDDLVAILAGYNAGKGKVRAWKVSKGRLEVDFIPFSETRNFVRLVLSNYRRLKFMQKIKQIVTFYR